jgi:hypothetical protein
VTRYHGAFTSVGKNGLLSYPLCYVKEIFRSFGSCDFSQAVTKLLTILSKLESELDSMYSGLVWECTVEVAIILRMLEAYWVGSEGPFGLVPAGMKPKLAFRTLPDECNTLEGARGFIDTNMSRSL